MNRLTGFTLAATLAISGLALTGQSMAGNMAHAHIGHVVTTFGDTPDNKGLLPTAVAEAKTAAYHAGLAAADLGDLASMQAHTRHVLHALDTSVEAKGPGLGYGLIKAAAGTTLHVELAAGSEGASDGVKAHTLHVATSANNTIARANMIVELGNKVLSASTAAVAAPHMEKLATLSDQLLAGADANGDGKIGWGKDEGGLNAATAHMGFMTKGEGL